MLYCETQLDFQHKCNKRKSIGSALPYSSCILVKTSPHLRETKKGAVSRHQADHTFIQSYSIENSKNKNADSLQHPAAIIENDQKGNTSKWSKTYNTEDSQVVTDPSTNSALCCLYMGERTGSLAFSRMWSYVRV